MQTDQIKHKSIPSKINLPQKKTQKFQFCTYFLLETYAEAKFLIAYGNS